MTIATQDAKNNGRQGFAATRLVLGTLVAASRELGRAARPGTPEPGEIDLRYVALGAVLLLEERAADVVRTAARVGRTVAAPVIDAVMPRTPERVRHDVDRFIRRLAETGRAAADAGAGQAVEIVEVLATDVTRDPAVIALIEGIVDSILPVALEQLAADEQVRQLVQQQSRGMIDDIADTARTRAADADEAVDRLVTRLFRRRAGASGQNGDRQSVPATAVTEP